MNISKMPVLGLFPEEIATYIEGPGYRAEQIFRWLHQKKAANFEAMSNLPAELRTKLAGIFYITELKEAAQSTADDASVKWLFATPRGDAVESVLMQAGTRRTLCISTQVGCKFGCAFCASGVAGFTRNLNADEMVAEILTAETLSPLGAISHIVVMGMGEPFDNDVELLRALRIINHPLGRGIGKRRITISTVGLPKKILAFSELNLPFELSVSLHSVIDEVRSRIMPVNRAFPVKTLLEACWKYAEKTRRQITFEFILIEGVNCDDANADALARALKKKLAKVNLIPYNPIAEFPEKRPSMAAIRRFEKKLRTAGVTVTVRFSKGLSADAACGQLRLRKLPNTAPDTPK